MSIPVYTGGNEGGCGRQEDNRPRLRNEMEREKARQEIGEALTPWEKALGRGAAREGVAGRRGAQITRKDKEGWGTR